MSGRVIAAVLWDMDGTLVDSEPLWIEAQRRLVRGYGREWTDQDGLRLVGVDMDATARALQARGVPLATAEIVARLTDEVTRSLERDVPWRPGAQELVRALGEADVPQAIVTTSPLAMAQAVAGRLADGAITVIVAAEHVTRGKPDPEPYLHAARMLEVDPRRCLAIEDSPTGLAAAVAAGTVAIGVPNDAVLAGDGTWTRLATLAGVSVAALAGIAARRQTPGRADPSPA